MTPIISNFLSKISDSINQAFNRVYPVSTLPRINNSSHTLEARYIFNAILNLKRQAKV